MICPRNSRSSSLEFTVSLITAVKKKGARLGAPLKIQLGARALVGGAHFGDDGVGVDALGVGFGNNVQARLHEKRRAFLNL